MFSFLKRRQYKGKMKQIGFIVGTGRCGTTILGQVLNSHSKICVPHELQIIVGIGNGDRLYEKYMAGEFKDYKAEDFIRLINGCCPYYFEKYFDYIQHFRDLNYPQNDLRKLLIGLFDHICFHFKKDIFLEQTPWQGQRLEILKKLFPGMKVIHIVRDGRDVAISYARTPWWSKDIGQNLLQWQREVKVISDFGRRNPENFLEIRYEDLVTEPESILTNVLQMFALRYESDMLRPDKLIDYLSFFKDNSAAYQSKENRKWEQAKKEVFFRGSIYSWKRQKEIDFSSLQDRVKTTLDSFGYET
jgi:Sulfotransferase family